MLNCTRPIFIYTCVCVCIIYAYVVDLPNLHIYATDVCGAVVVVVALGGCDAMLRGRICVTTTCDMSSQRCF